MVRLLFVVIGCVWLLAVRPGGATSAWAKDPLVFDFKDIKETNAVALTIDAPWEPVVGYADGVSGTATFDPENPRATTGEIRVEVSSIRFSHPGYSETVKGFVLEGEKHPQILCRLKRIVDGKEVSKGVYQGQVEVDFTCHGITKALTIPLKVSYLPGVAKKRDPRTEGDLMVVRSTFAIKRTDFDLAKGVASELVGDEVEVRVAIVGVCNRKQVSPSTPQIPVTETPKKNYVVRVEGKDYSVAERMAFYKVPGASLVIIKDFKVASVAHWGKRNANSPITDDTLYQIGAMGQPLVTVAALRAAERGAISLDTNIDTYLKTWKIPSSNTLDPKRGITLRDLLTQRSGFTFHKYSGYASDAPIPTLLQVLKGEKPATTPPASVTGIPGKTFTLAAENYTVLQQVAADITGEPFDSVLRSEVFAPLGLEKSNALQPLPENRRGNAAFGHNAQGTPLPGGYRIYPEIAASGIWSTPREYALFLADVLKSIAGQEGTLLQKETAQLLITPISSDANSVQTMGFGINRRNGVPILFRGGNSEGFYCHLDADFEKGDAIIFFANGDLCWRLSNEVRDAVGRTEGFRGYTSP